MPKSLTAKNISDENKMKLIIPAFCLSSITIFVMLVLVVGVFIRHRIDHSTRYNVEQDWNAKSTTSQVAVIKLTPKNSFKSNNIYAAGSFEYKYKCFREYLLRMKLRLDPRLLLRLKTIEDAVNHCPMSLVARPTAAQIRKMMYSTWISKLIGHPSQNFIYPYTYNSPRFNTF